MELTDILGLVAGACTTLSFVPQVLKVWRSRSTQDISLGMYCVFVLGIGLWLIYGLILRSTPLMIANGITFILAGMVLTMKLRFDRKARSN